MPSSPVAVDKVDFTAGTAEDLKSIGKEKLLSTPVLTADRVWLSLLPFVRFLHVLGFEPGPILLALGCVVPIVVCTGFVPIFLVTSCIPLAHLHKEMTTIWREEMS